MAVRNKACCCCETRYVAKKDYTVLRYDFVSGDGMVPSSCVIHLGDSDLRTGERITDLTVFVGYYELVNREVRSNLKQIRPERTRREIAARKRAGGEYAAGFEQMYGYCPGKDAVQVYLDNLEGPRCNVSYDESLNDDGDR